MRPQQLPKKRTIRSAAQSSRPTPFIPPPDGRRWLKVTEAAAYLGVSLHHVYRMHRRGQLPSFKLPGLGVRIDRKALDAKIDSVKGARARAADVSWPAV
jgi:excisionase family DNA binding protein